MCSDPGWGLHPLTAPSLNLSQIRGGLDALKVLSSQRPGPILGAQGEMFPVLSSGSPALDGGRAGRERKRGNKQRKEEALARFIQSTNIF